MSDTLRTAFIFLIETLFNLYLFILAIRLILVWVRTDYFNPITQFVTRFTDKLIRPIRQRIPNIGNLETATVLSLIAIEMIKFFLLVWISFGIPNLLGLPILAIADIISLIIKIFTYGIILQVILSFIQPYSPLMPVLWRINSPIMQPIQRLIPPIGGIDLSPIPALIILQFLSIILVNPLMSLGQQML